MQGVGVDEQTRCIHFHSALDIIAIKMACCGMYYACKDCHEALAGHAMQPWPRAAWDARAVLCGACGHELTVHEYLDSNSLCPHCGSAFNPACRNHHHVYFALDDAI